MVMPAAASTSFSPSSKILISSSIFSGAFPVFGSSPILPARYRVFPARIASLNGNCAGLSGRLIAFLVGCIVTCENAPRTVRIPATAKTTARKLMRRFILCLHSNDLLDMPRECNTQLRLRQAVRRNLAPRQTTISIASRNSFESESDKPRSNEVQRSESHPKPQNHSKKQRPPSHLFQRGAGDAAANEEQCCGEAESAESEKSLGGGRQCRQVRVRERSENEEPDEPGELDAGTA